MQGVFRGRPKLDAGGFDSVLTHPQTMRKVSEKVPDLVGAAAAPPAVPNPGDTIVKDVVSYPPMQRFKTDDDKTVFIKPKSDAGINETTVGHWLVRHIIEEEDPAAAAAAAFAVPAPPVPKMGRPEDAKRKLQESDRDSLNNAEKASLLLMIPIPNMEYTQRYRHYLLPQDTHYEIGELYLKKSLEKAEKYDYQFAVRMQGLQNTTINAVWSCQDPGGEPSDRAEVMEQFMRKFVSRFMGEASQNDASDVEMMINEAVQMHQEFSDRWVSEHKRCLSPTIEAASEALVGMFWNGALRPAVVEDMTWKEMSRVIRRDPRLSPQFGICLHFYMVKLEQDRGSRNASYKSMYNASSSNMLSINSMDAFFKREIGYMCSLTQKLIHTGTRVFDPLTMDWHGIVSQLHLPKVRYAKTKKQRVAYGEGELAPWDPAP
jgi:hypothetical protein